MMKLLSACLGLMLIGAAPARDGQCRADNPQLRVSDLQYVTTHNAYHVAPDDAVFSFIRATGRLEAGQPSIEQQILAHDYTHPTLTRQLLMGVRAFEIDVHDDPAGGRFSKPAIYNDMPRSVVDALPPLDPSSDLTKPGFKTFHETDFDMRSTCLLFRKCLKEIADWHKTNPQHVPIFILLEMKVGAGQAVSGDPSLVWRRLQDEILSEFALRELILPSDLQRDLMRWPTLGSARGKIAFLLFDYGDRPVERYAEYISASRDRALLHIEEDLGGQRATWRSRNNPSTIDRISAKNGPGIKPGLLLYTKADTTGVQDRARSELALSTSANFVATDFLTPYTKRSDYSVSFHGRYWRSNCGQR